MQIREATFDDIPDLCRLLNYLFEQEEEFKPDINLQRIGIQKILEDNEKGKILIIRDHDKTIGMVNLLFTISTAFGSNVALLEDMVVFPSERRKGYGSKLLKAAIDYAEKKGCKRITLLTDHSNDQAQEFYIRHGFTPSTMQAMRYLFN